MTNLATLPDGRLAATVGGTLVVWSPDDGTAAPIVSDQGSSRVTGMGMLDDGRLLLNNGDHINAWDPATGETEQGFYQAQSSSRAIVALTDGTVASSGGGFGESYGVQVWDPSDPLGTPVLHPSANEISDMVLLPDGRLAAVTWQDGLQVWDPTDQGAAPTTIDLEGVAVAAFADGRVVVGSPKDHPVTVWNLDDPSQPVATFDGHTSTVRTVLALSDGRVASGGNDGTIQVWHPDRLADPALVAFGAGGIWSLAEMSDGRLLAGGSDGLVYVWDLGAADPDGGRVPLPQPESELSLADLAVDADNDGEAGEEGAAPSAQPVVERFEGHGEKVGAVFGLPDGRVVSFDSEAALVWDPADLRAAPVRYVFGRDPVRNPQVSPDGLVLWNRRSRVEIWDPSDPDAEPRGNQFRLPEPTALAVLPSGELLYRTSRSVQVVDVDQPDAEPVVFEQAPGSGAPPNAVSPDGRFAFYTTPTEALLIVVDLEDPSAVPTSLVLDDFGGFTAALTTLPDGRVVIAGVDGGGRNEVRVLDPGDAGAAPVRYREHLAAITAVATLPDGRILSGDHNGEVHLWNPDDPSAVTYGPATDCERPVEVLTVLGDGTTVAVGQLRDVWLWPLSSAVPDQSPCA